MPAVVSLVEIDDINAVPPGRKIAWKCSSENLDPIMRRFDRLNSEYRCGEYSGRGEVTNSANSQVRVSDVLRNAAEDGKLYLVEDANYWSDEVLNALPVKLGAAFIFVGVLGGIAHTCLAPDFSGAVSFAISRAGEAFSRAVSFAFSRAVDSIFSIVGNGAAASSPFTTIADVGASTAASSPFTTIADVGASTASNSAISKVLDRVPHRIVIVVPFAIMSLLSRRPRFPGRRGSI